MTKAPQVPLNFSRLDEKQMLENAVAFRNLLSKRRTVRDFSNKTVPRTLIQHCVMSGGTAPSGANQQPWTFVCISDQATKRNIREAAEAEEREFYAGRASDEWLEALGPLGTNEDKPFLETAPWLIVIFAQRYGVRLDGKKIKHYYVPESVGIATGLLIASLHNAGLATLTHTPSPMGFLNALCGRPDHEKALILLVAGYPADDATVPAITRKAEDDIIVWKE